MKFEIFEDRADEWRWNAQSGGNILFSSGEGFEKPQKIVQTIRRNIVRGDEKLEKALVKALKEVGLNEKGGLIRKTATTPEKKLTPLVRAKKRVDKPKDKPKDWPFPTGNAGE